jgi:hypothetical protein
MEFTLKGGAGAQILNEVRALNTFRIGLAGLKVEVHELWADTDARLAWIVCHSGMWRLPDRLLPWARTVEARAAEMGFANPWPCWALFEEDPDGVVEVEIFPDGYRSSGR